MESAAGPGARRGTIFAMAAAAGVAVANIYYNQPMLRVIEADFAGSTVAHWVPTATQLGYAASLLLVLPFGDVTDRRRLVVAQFGVLALALVFAAVAPSATMLVVASLLVGASATVAQQLVPFAATLAAPEHRGRTIGVVLGGILTGILLSRTLAGFVAANAGWRDMFWLGVPLALLAAGVMAAVLPPCPARETVGYRGALGSLAALWRAHPALRRAAVVQGLAFASFSTFWTVLAFRLGEPRFGLGADAAGLFGVVGAVGILAAPMAGRAADRRGPAAVADVAVVLVPPAWAAFALWPGIAGICAGIVVLDLAVQGALVANQNCIFSLDAAARSRLNTVLMTTMFLGGAAGSAAAGLAYAHGGWAAVCVLGAALGFASAAVQLARHVGRGAAGRPAR